MLFLPMKSVQSPMTIAYVHQVPCHYTVQMSEPSVLCHHTLSGLSIFGKLYQMLLKHVQILPLSRSNLRCFTSKNYHHLISMFLVRGPNFAAVRELTIHSVFVLHCFMLLFYECVFIGFASLAFM